MTTWSTARKVLLAGLLASIVPAVAYGRSADTTGLLTLCTAGARPAGGTFVFTMVAPAAEGGTQTFTVPAGGCGSRIFITLGTVVTVTETLPSGFSVTSIKITPTAGGGGTASVVASSNLSAGSAAVTIGTGQANLTFTTKGSGAAGGGGSGSGSACKVPNVFGLASAAAKTAIVKAHCTVGAVRKVHSDVFYPDRVMTQSPQHGATLAPKARVNLTVSLGH
jgi:PASTA domain